MNQGKLEVVKEEMARVNVYILGIRLYLDFLNSSSDLTAKDTHSFEDWYGAICTERKCTGQSKHPLPTTQEKTLHTDITRWSTPKSD